MARARNIRLGIAIAAVALSLSATVFYKANPITSGAQRYAVSVASASAGIYITLRTLNAVLSTAQEVEVGGTLVVSGTVQPLKMLEPIDDTIERIASFVFFVMVVTGVIAVAMTPVGAIGFAMVTLSLLISVVQERTGRFQTAGLASALGWYGAFLGLALPLAFASSALVADHLTDDVWARNKLVIDEITAHVEPGAAKTEGEAGGWFWGLPDAVEEVDRYKELAQNIYDRADDLIASYLEILAVFVFKIIFLPALLVGALYFVLRFPVRRLRAQ